MKFVIQRVSSASVKVNKEVVGKINKGFLYGPYLPIYGIGALLVTYLLVGYYSDPIVVFIIGLIICSCLEYFLNYSIQVIINL